MTSHDHRSDMDLDAAIEALARVPPPTGHLERVLASTGPGLEATPPAWRLALRQPRWVLPIAATLIAAGATLTRMPRADTWPPDLPSTAASAWATPRELDRPVLPPEMYWAMDPGAEFATLRPIPPATAGQPVMAAVFAGDVPVAVERGVAWPLDDEYVMPDTPSGLPEIRLAVITPAPLVMPPLPRPAAIGMPAIAMAPIPMAPIQTYSEEENP